MAGQGRAAPLDLLGGLGRAGRGHARGELHPADRRRLQHGQVGGLQPLQLELDQAPQVVGDFGVGAARPGQLPAARRRPQHARVHPRLGELGDEQGHAVGAAAHRPGQLLGDLAAVEPLRQRGPDGVGVELAEPQLGRPAPQEQVGGGRVDRVPGGAGVGRAVGADQQQPGPAVTAGQPLDHVDG